MRLDGTADVSTGQVPANPPTTDLTIFIRDVPLKLD
jgi:hypothetical protein